MCVLLWFLSVLLVMILRFKVFFWLWFLVARVCFSFVCTVSGRFIFSFFLCKSNLIVVFVLVVVSLRLRCSNCFFFCVVYY